MMLSKPVLVLLATVLLLAVALTASDAKTRKHKRVVQQPQLSIELLLKLDPLP